ncbi:emerin isoform X3 [Sceloporus undulatus]|uniref:emerin isoform X3 n=1 Tax=Sceloporus undulatus TaxID=8520 RepID=UPI001C4D9140|nr:emerin isoform X3 [Sceloporus undulatus]
MPKGTTRKLYEKKIYEYEKRLGWHQPLPGSPAVYAEARTEAHKTSHAAVTPQIFPDNHIAGEIPVRSADVSGPRWIQPHRRYRSLLPKTTSGPHHPSEEMSWPGAMLITGAEIPPQSDKPSAPPVRSRIPCRTGTQIRDSACSHGDSLDHRQQQHNCLKPSFSKRTAQIAVPALHGQAHLPEALEPGSTMEEYKGLTDNELIARLKKYSIPHGPIVGSTRKLYEKKVYEYETERMPLPSHGGSGSSYTEPSSSRSESYVRETYVSPRSRENLSYGREALGSGRTYLRENYDAPRTEEYYSEYRNEDPSPSKSYLSQNYGLSHHEERSNYAPEDWDINSSENSTSSYRRYASSLSSDVPSGRVSARQPIAEPYAYSSSWKDVSTDRDSSSYQSVFQRKSSGLSSFGVEPRRAIHPERQAQAAAEKATSSSASTKRYLPLWPQLLLFVLLAGFLAFVYFYLQSDADDNPFAKHLNQ